MFQFKNCNLEVNHITTLSKPYKIQISEKDNAVILEIETNQKLPIFKVKSTSTSSKIMAKNNIKKIKQITQKYNDVVRLETNYKLKYKLYHDKPNKKLILDFLNTTNKLPLIIQKPGYHYNQIKTSIFKRSPLTSRVVINLNSKNVSHSIKQTDKYLDITLSNKSIKNITTPIKSKIVKSGLKNRVIVIDPGHGGIDPGGVGIKKFMKKISHMIFQSDLKIY